MSRWNIKSFQILFQSEEMNILFDAEVETKSFNPNLKIFVRVLLDSGSTHANLINEKNSLELV